MRYRDRRTGAVYEPRSEAVAAMMAANGQLEALDAPKAAKKAKKKAAKGKE